MNVIFDDVPVVDLAPWYYLEENIIRISLIVSGIVTLILLVSIIVNFIKHKKINKKILIVFIIALIIFILFFTGLADEYVLNPLLQKIYGY